MHPFTRPAAALLLTLLLAACGGGAAEGAQPAAEEIVQTVGTDSYDYHRPFGVQDRTFAPLSYTNASTAAADVRVTVTSARTVTAPTGLVGTTDVTSKVFILNTTAGQLVGSAQDDQGAQVQGLAAGQTRSYSEDNVFTVSVPAGSTFEFRSYTRVAPSVGSVGLIRLQTRDLELRVVPL